MAIGGCSHSPEETINIFYREIGVCKTYDTADGPVSARPDEAFVVFEIEAVDNLTSKTFSFDPSLVYVDQSHRDKETVRNALAGRRYALRDPRFSKSVGAPGAERAAIPKERKVDLDTFIGVAVSADESNQPAAASYDLRYDVGAYEAWRSEPPDGFLYIKTNAFGETGSFKDDCKEAARTPSSFGGDPRSVFRRRARKARFPNLVKASETRPP